jgi:hypothetical protein
VQRQIIMRSAHHKSKCRAEASLRHVKACKLAWRVPECAAMRAAANLCFTSSMDEYKNPYHDDPELTPLTRVGRVMECAVAVLLALLAIYVSR